MKPLLFACFSLLALALPPVAQAATDCENAMTTADMRACASLEHERADAELNRAYKEARAAAKEADALHGEFKDSGAVAALLTAQRAWIQLRDASCKLDGFAFRGGTMESVVVIHCLAEMSAKRAQELWDLAEYLRI